MTMLQILIYSFLSLSLGYILGRVGHCYLNVWIGNPYWLPHHWIYGAALIPASYYFTSSIFGLILLFFGIGHLVSDFKDFFHLRFFSPDEKGPKRFFHID